MGIFKYMSCFRLATGRSLGIAKEDMKFKYLIGLSLRISRFLTRFAKICTREKCSFGKLPHFLPNFGDFCSIRWLIHENVIIYSRIRSFLSPRKEVPLKINTNKVPDKAIRLNKRQGDE